MALIQFLSSGQLKPPRAITTTAKRDDPNVGFVVPSFEQGSLTLKDAKGQYVRLSWEGGQRKQGTAKKKSVKGDSDDRLRALAPGVYTVTGYRILRRDKRGRSWFISATSAGGIRKLTVRKGQVNRVRISDVIHVQCRTQPTDEGIRVIGGVQGEHQSGLSVYRDGKRIALHYIVRGAGGEKLAAGTMKYG